MKLNFEDTLKKANVFERLVLFVSFIATIAFSYPVMTPYLLFQKYIPLEECSITGGQFVEADKRNGYDVIRFNNNGYVESYSVSGLGYWVIEQAKILPGYVQLYQCPYIHWSDTIGQITINGKEVYRYSDEERFNQISDSHKNALFVVMPVSLSVFLFTFIFVRRKNSSRQPKR